MDVVMRIETSVGLGVLRIAQDLSRGDISASKIVSILTPVLRTSGKDFSEKEVGALVWEGGLTQGLQTVAEVMGHIISGGGSVGNEQAEVQTA
jgi:hypothetical protein